MPRSASESEVALLLSPCTKLTRSQLKEPARPAGNRLLFVCCKTLSVQLV